MMRGWVAGVARELAGVQPRRGLLRVMAVLLTLFAAGSENRLNQIGEAKRRSKRRRQKKQKKSRRRRRRRNTCRLLPSGAECGEGAQCCSGTCEENTAFPQFETVCCRAEGESCVIGRNECCQDFTCQCAMPDCIAFNGDAGKCG